MSTSHTARQTRILWIAFVFPPVGGTQGLRMQRYLQEITTADPEVIIDVLTIRQTARNPQFDERLSVEAAGRIRVHRVRPGILHTVRYRWNLDRWSLARRNTAATAISLSAIHLSNLGWIPWAALRLAMRKARDRRTYDAVYVFVDPFASLFLGLIAAVLHPTARLVLEYGDPRVPVRNGRRSLMRAGAALERRVLCRSSASIFRTQAAVRTYRAYYPSVPAGSFTVLYGGVDWDAYDAIPSPVPGSGEFLIAYTGTLYADSVDAAPFFKAVARVVGEAAGSVWVRMAGAENPVAVRLVRDLGLDGVVSFSGHVPAAEVVSMQRSAAVLLAFGTRVSYKVSSKLAQYVAARVPILFICDSPDDPGAELVSRSRRGVVVQNEAEAIAAAIVDLRRSWRHRDLEARFDLRRTDQYSWQQVGAGVGSLLTGDPEGGLG